MADGGETLVTIRTKPQRTQVPGQKALLRGEKEPARRSPTDRSASRGGPCETKEEETVLQVKADLS